MTDILKVKVNGEWVSIPAIKGDNGQDGQDGEGVPTGGTTGQVLTKKTNTDFDTEWQTLDAIPNQTGQSGKYLTTDGSSASWGSIPTPTDVQINGTSIVSSNVANIVTNTAYDASSNKIATMSDVPSTTNLANKDLSNISSTGKIAIAHNAMPSNTYIDLTLGASGSSYTAPADGYVFVSKFATGPGQYFNLQTGGNTDDTVKIQDSRMMGYVTSGWCLLTCTIPVTKGETFYTVYNAVERTVLFRFYYAQGAESEAS